MHVQEKEDDQQRQRQDEKQALLRSLSGYEPYRRAYDARIVPERVLMVVGPGGRTVVGVVSADVKDIKKIKEKEKVTIRFTQEVALAVRKADGVPEAVQNKFEQRLRRYSLNQ